MTQTLAPNPSSHRRGRPHGQGRAAPEGRSTLIFELRAFIALAVLIIVFGSLSDSFLTVTNLITMTKHVAINAVLALGMLLVILKGGIDLSVGSIVGLSGVVGGELLGGIRLPGTDTIAYPPVWVRGDHRDRGRHVRRLDQRRSWSPGSTSRRSSPRSACCTWLAGRPC